MGDSSTQKERYYHRRKHQCRASIGKKDAEELFVVRRKKKKTEDNAIIGEE